MYEKVIELLRLLLPQTRAGKVTWEYLADEEMIRARVGKGLLRIGRETGTLTPDRGPELHDATYYPIWVIGPGGGITDEFVITPLEPTNYAIVAQLYQEARAKAQDSNQVLQSMIDALKAS
jgi:hypothetical protein